MVTEAAAEACESPDAPRCADAIVGAAADGEAPPSDADELATPAGGAAVRVAASPDADVPASLRGSMALDPPAASSGGGSASRGASCRRRRQKHASSIYRRPTPSVPGETGRSHRRATWRPSKRGRRRRSQGRSPPGARHKVRTMEQVELTPPAEKERAANLRDLYGDSKSQAAVNQKLTWVTDTTKRPTELDIELSEAPSGPPPRKLGAHRP